MKIINKLYQLKKGNKVFINGKKYFVLSKEKTTIPEHKPLNEVLILLTNNRMISVDKNDYSIYRIIDFWFFFKIRFLLRIRKTPKIHF
jgi:hypothetical protein